MWNSLSGRSFPAIIILAAAAEGALAQRAAPVQGIPIDHKLTIEKCGGCHKTDQNGMMGRLSFMRTTPEIWQQTIKRMMRLNGVVATPAEVREIVQYLSNNNGLAPEELETAFWEVDHSLPGHQYDHVPSAVGTTCNYCHTIGRVLLQRRTRDDYEKLASFHVGLFPGAENQFRPRRTQQSSWEVPARIDDPGPNGVVSIAPARIDTKAPYPIDTVIDYLAKNQPLITPEWTAWKATMATPKLAGTARFSAL
jgi:quinohemoprotein amine dehydrogenase